MEENYEIYREPKYTISWLGLHSLFAFGIALVLALITVGINGFASERAKDGLLSSASYSLFSESTIYCFAVIAISTISIMLVEVAFRKGINYLQYTLIAFALTIFYLLLLAVSEKLPFGMSYAIVSAMTISLISIFIIGLTANMKAVGLTVSILAVEYGVMFLLINIGTMALLVGSVSLFLLIALAMYFTLKLKVENEELIIK